MKSSRNSARGVAVLLGASLGAGLLGISAPLAHAQTSSISSSTEQWVVEVSSKAQRPPDKPYFIEFRARAAASYGHMYVLYGRVNARDEIVESRIAGLHPTGDAANCNNCSLFYWTVGHLIPVPAETGASDGDLEEKYVTARYRVWMDKAHYEELDSYIRKLQADSPVWNALLRSCVSFGRDIAEHMGLKIPWLPLIEPKTFVDAMRFMNGVKTEQLPLKDAATAAVERSASRTASRTPRPRHKPKVRPAAVGQPTVSVLPKPAPGLPKKPVAQSATVQALASSRDTH
jgi:hypothetical protein